MKNVDTLKLTKPDPIRAMRQINRLAKDYRKSNVDRTQDMVLKHIEEISSEVLEAVGE